MPEVAYGSLPFQEAIDYFRQKGYAFSPEGWRDVWQEAHARAFTVARVTEMDVLVDIREEVQKALDSGTSLKQFQVDLPKTLERKGWFAPSGVDAWVTLPDGTKKKRLTAWRLETIYRANLQTAYSVGRYKQMQDVRARRPYWQYKGIRDSATRPSHLAQFDKVYHVDHPFWDEWYPPNGFNCRCYVKTLSVRQLRERGLNEETRDVEEKPDEGWRYNPGKARLGKWKPETKKYPKKLRQKYLEQARYQELERKTIGDWQKNSGTTGAQLLQEIANKKFRKGKGFIYREYDYVFNKKDLRDGSKFIQEMYDRTQEALRREGIERITLYRGVQDEINVESVLSSWSTEREIAEEFDGHKVLKMEVEAKDILTYHKMWEAPLYPEQREFLVINRG